MKRYVFCSSAVVMYVAVSSTTLCCAGCIDNGIALDTATFFLLLFMQLFSHHLLTAISNEDTFSTRSEANDSRLHEDVLKKCSCY